MNKVERKLQILKNYKKYHSQGCPNYQRPKMNVCAPAGGLKHSMAIMAECWAIKKYGEPIDFTDKMRKALKVFESEVKNMGIKPNKLENAFVCEVVPNDPKRQNRRIDITILHELEEVELETDKKIRKEGARTIYV